MNNVLKSVKSVLLTIQMFIMEGVVLDAKAAGEVSDVVDAITNLLDTGEVVEFPFKFGEQVYYAALNGLGQRMYLKSGSVFGYSVYSRKAGLKSTELDIRVNFKKDNGIYIKHVSRDKQYVEQLIQTMNEEIRRDLEVK